MRPQLRTIYVLRDYILFVDTETSGLPVDWYAPYTTKKNWPYIVQIAWVIYNKSGKHIKTENHYIINSDYEITRASGKIHGIDHNFLSKYGKKRKAVMQRLYDDLEEYQPLTVGHFMQLDYHMIGLGFHRSGMENPVEKLPCFCTMKASNIYSRNPYHKYLRLGELYELLFKKNLKTEHDALEDASATASCFFEMIKRGDISDEVVENQKLFEIEREGVKNKTAIAIFITLIILSILIIIYLL